MERELKLLDVPHAKPEGAKPGKKLKHTYRKVEGSNEIYVDENGQFYKRYMLNKTNPRTHQTKAYPAFLAVDSEKVNFAGKFHRNENRTAILTMIRRLNPTQEDLIEIKKFVITIYERKINEAKNGRLQQQAS